MKTEPLACRHAPHRIDTLRARDVMQHELVTVHASDPLREVERVLLEAQISGVPVVDDDGRVLGVVSMREVVSRYASDRDLLEHAFDDPIEDSEPTPFLRPDDEPCAGGVMSTDLVTVAPETPLATVACRMVDGALHRALVLDRGRLLGIVTTMDVLRAVAGAHAARCR